MQLRFLVAPLACVMLVCALGACEDAASPAEPTSSPSSVESTELSPSPSATSTEPTGPVEPTLPAAAEKSTKDGAEAFVEYYWEVVNYASATGDTSTLKDISLHGCQTCWSGIAWIDDVYAAGGRITGGSYEVLRQTSQRTPSGSWGVAARIKVGRQAVQNAGTLNETFPKGVRSHILDVSLDRSGWQVVSWEIR